MLSSTCIFVMSVQSSSECQWCIKMLQIAGAVCGVAGLLLYLNTLDCGFCYDDQEVLIQNKDLLPSSSWKNLLWNDFWGNPIHLNTSHKSYRPLCVASFRLNYMLHGLDPMGYHLVNVLLHAVVCYLYVQLCALVFTAVWPALLAGLLFAVHPIHTEAVTGVVGRADLMSALFYLLCLLFYHHHVTNLSRYAPANVHDERKWCQVYLVLCIGCAICSTLCKELGLTAIGVCLAYDLVIFQQSGFHNWQSKWIPHQLTSFMKRSVVLLGCAALLLVLRLLLMKDTPQFSKVDNEGLSLASPYRQLHWSYLASVNAWLLLNPTYLIHDYRMKVIPLITSLWDARHVCTLLTLLVLAFLFKAGLHGTQSVDSAIQQTCVTLQTGAKEVSAMQEKSGRNISGDGVSHISLRVSHGRVILVGLFLLIIPFVPASNLFFPVGFVVAERILYLPSMGLCLIVGYAAYKMATSKHRLLSTCTKIGFVWLILTYSTKTMSRNRDWYSKLSLYSSFLKYSPDNAHMLVNAAKEFRNTGDFQRAELAYRHAMTVAPDLPSSYVNFGSMLNNLQRYQQAEEVLYQAIPVLLKEDPVNVKCVASIYTTLCNIISTNSSRLMEATELCQRAVSSSSESSTAHNSLGAVLLHRGENSHAIKAFKRATALNRTNIMAEYNLALAYISTGEEKLAVQSLERVLQATNNYAPALAHLQELKRKMG